MIFGFEKRGANVSSAERAGFTLLELTISMAILVVVSGLTFVVTQSTTSAVAVSEAKEMAQAGVRNALTDMTNELSLASKKTNAGLVPPLAALQVVSASEILFQIPDGTSGTTYSEPITYRFENEDVNGNAILDSGEDKDEDGALTRHIIRIQGDTRRVMGTTNNVSAVQFSLNAPTNDMLTITLTATKAVNDRRRNLISSTATSTVYLSN
jgi:prepilin-type N-terminal cleavage/methylation domain-containing protein